MLADLDPAVSVGFLSMDSGAGYSYGTHLYRVALQVVVRGAGYSPWYSPLEWAPSIGERSRILPMVLTS